MQLAVGVLSTSPAAGEEGLAEPGCVIYNWFIPNCNGQFDIKAAEERGYWELMGGNQYLGNSVRGV